MIGTIFMVLVVLFLYFNVYIFMQNQDTKFQDAIGQSAQLDADRSTEKITIATQTSLITGNQVTISCTLTNNGPLPIKIIRLWIKDLSTNNLAQTDSSPLPLVLAPGNFATESSTVTLINAQGPFYLEFVTSRGNLLTATAT